VAVFASVGEKLRPRGRRRWKRFLASVPQDFPGPLRVLPSPPARARWLWREDALLGRRLRGQGLPLVVHARGAVATALALRARPAAKDVRVIYDCRGLEREELLYREGCRDSAEAPRDIRDRAEQLFTKQRKAAEESDAVLCVSEAMKNFLVTAFAVPEPRITVVPCCTDVEAFGDAVASRGDTRRRLLWEDRFVVVFCGSSQPWHLPRECARVFKRIRHIVPAAHFLLITPRPGDMRELLHGEGLGPEEATVIRAEPAEVPGYLAAADLALLIRDEAVVNRVASPAKFAEYLAAGLPVVVSEGVGDYAALAGRESCGAVLPHDVPEDERRDLLARALRGWRADPESIRSRCRRVAAEFLSWDAHLPALIGVYEELGAVRDPVRHGEAA
jgi:glycosyltransferase involved in cell wall biosynthesis